MQKVRLYTVAMLLGVAYSSASSGQTQPKGVVAACDAKGWRRFWDGKNVICVSPEAMRQREVAERLKAKEQRAYLRKNYSVYEPSREQVWDFIKENWKDYRYEFFRNEDAIPVRINDLICVFNTTKYKTDVFECHVGLLGMDGRNPLYANIKLDFIREYYEFTDPFPKLKIFEDDRDTIIIN